MSESPGESAFAVAVLLWLLSTAAARDSTSIDRARAWVKEDKKRCLGCPSFFLGLRQQCFFGPLKPYVYQWGLLT